MTFMQELNQFLKENPNFNDFVFRTETLDEAKALVKTLYKLGYYWEKNIPYTDEEVERRWKQKKKETCISIGTLNSPDKKQLFNGRQGMFTKQGRMVVGVNTLFEEVNDDTIESLANEPYNNTRKLCPQCNNELSKKAKFCTSCGYKFEDVSNTSNNCSPGLNDLSSSKTEIKNNNIEKTDIQRNDVALHKAEEPDIVTQENSSEIVLVKNENTSVQPPIIKNANETKVFTEQKQTENNVVNINTTDSEQKEEVTPDTNQKEMTNEDKKVSFSLLNKQTASQNLEDKDIDNIPNLCKILNVEINQSFTINNSFYNSDNCIFRINKNGYREKKVGPDIWFIANNEQELAYIIENKNQINKL